jgi:hypothetical protein
MSTGQVSRCKTRLAAPIEELGGKPLIRIVERPSQHGGKPYHEIRVVDIWDDNDQYFSSRQSPPTSGRELGTSANEIAMSPVEPKKTLKRKISEEGVPSVSPSSRESETAPLSEFWNFLCTIFGRDEVEDQQEVNTDLCVNGFQFQTKSTRLSNGGWTLRTATFPDQESHVTCSADLRRFVHYCKTGAVYVMSLGIIGRSANATVTSINPAGLDRERHYAGAVIFLAATFGIRLFELVH